MEIITKEQLAGLKKLQEPFKESEISDLPKPTKKQTDDVKQDFKQGIRCEVCGGWHHRNVVHLKYVGHAALTKRLLDADPTWNWEPVAVNEDGTPKLDKDSGMWGKLTVCGVTRLGYGDAQGKNGPNATKEVIGDFLRNAAMRFGAALDLWSKADLTKNDIEEDTPPSKPQSKEQPPAKKKDITAEYLATYIDEHIKANNTPAQLENAWMLNVEPILKNYTETEQNKIHSVYTDTLAYLKEGEA